jgi:hypothetical protein
MTVARYRNEIGPDPRDRRNYQQRDGSDEKAKPFSE